MAVNKSGVKFTPMAHILVKCRAEHPVVPVLRRHGIFSDYTGTSVYIATNNPSAYMLRDLLIKDYNYSVRNSGNAAIADSGRPLLPRPRRLPSSSRRVQQRSRLTRRAPPRPHHHSVPCKLNTTLPRQEDQTFRPECFRRSNHNQRLTTLTPERWCRHSPAAGECVSWYSWHAWQHA